MTKISETQPVRSDSGTSSQDEPARMRGQATPGPATIPSVLSGLGPKPQASGPGDLPNEVLHDIAERLSPRDRIALRQTNKDLSTRLEPQARAATVTSGRVPTATRPHQFLSALGNRDGVREPEPTSIAGLPRHLRREPLEALTGKFRNMPYHGPGILYDRALDETGLLDPHERVKALVGVFGGLFRAPTAELPHLFDRSLSIVAGLPEELRAAPLRAIASRLLMDRMANPSEAFRRITRAVDTLPLRRRGAMLGYLAHVIPSRLTDERKAQAIDLLLDAADRLEPSARLDALARSALEIMILPASQAARLFKRVSEAVGHIPVDHRSEPLSRLTRTASTLGMRAMEQTIAAVVQLDSKPQSEILGEVFSGRTWITPDDPLATFALALDATANLPAEHRGPTLAAAARSLVGAVETQMGEDQGYRDAVARTYMMADACPGDSAGASLRTLTGIARRLGWDSL